MIEATPYLPRVDEREETFATSAMHELLRMLFERVFGRVSYPAQCAEQIHSLAARGVVIYVARARSTWLALFFNYAFSRLGLPLAQFVGGINLLLWQPIDRVRKILRQRTRTVMGPWRSQFGAATLTRTEASLADIVIRGEAALLFLRDPPTDPWPTPKANDCLPALAAAQ